MSKSNAKCSGGNGKGTRASRNESMLRVKSWERDFTGWKGLAFCGYFKEELDSFVLLPYLLMHMILILVTVRWGKIAMLLVTQNSNNRSLSNF